MSKKKLKLGEIVRKLNEAEGGESTGAIENPIDTRSSDEAQQTSSTQDHQTDKEDILPEQPVRNIERPQNSGEKPKTASPGAPHHWKAGHETSAAGTMPFSIPLTDHKTGIGDGSDEEEDFDLFRYIGVMLRRKNIIIASAILMTLFSIFRYINSDKYYLARARLLFRPDNQEIIGEQRTIRFYADREKLFNTHLELLKSGTVLKRVCENLDNRIEIPAILEGLTVKQGETAGEKNDIIELSYKNHSSETARDVINEICRTYIDYRRDVNSQEITRLIYKFETQIGKLQSVLDAKESDLRKFKEDNRMVQLSSETNLLISKLSDMELELQKTQLQLVETKERITALNSQISKQEQEVVQSITYHDPFQNRLSALELELNTLSSEYSPEHYKVKMLKQQIEMLKSAAADSLNREAASRTMVTNPIRQALLQELINLTIEKSATETKRTAQEQIIEKLNHELLALPSLEQRYAYLQRETESQLQTLRLLKTKYEEAKIRRDSQESDLKILELADTPTIAISSVKLSSIAIGFLIGIIIGIALAFLIEYLDQSLKDPSDVEKILELPLLGIVPLLDPDETVAEKGGLPKNLLEPFRALRANLKHIAAANNLKTFIICSAVKGEGKTTLASNLAITFALDGKKVILIDADLRRSQLHSMFDIPKQKGFSDYLLSTTELDDIIKPTRFENLSVITSGDRPDSPAELLGTVRFDMMLQEIKSRADVIIFDSPALLPVSDTLIMAPKMDCCITVVRTLYSPVKAAKQAKNQLRRIGCKLFGSILNGVSHSRGYYPYYGYYGYNAYKYSYNDDHDVRDFSIRKIGLNFENWLKRKLSSSAFSMPGMINSTGSFLEYLSRKKTTWVLLIIMLSLTGLHFWYQLTNKQTFEEDFQYMGVSGQNADDMSVPITSEHSDSGVSSIDLRDSVAQWIGALSEKNRARYLSFYDTINFSYSGGSFREWIQEFEKNDRSRKPGFSVRLEKIIEQTSRGNKKEILAEISEISGIDTLRYGLLSLWQSGKDGWRIVEEKKVSNQE